MQYTSHGKFYDICKDDHSSETRKASRQDNQTLHSYRITFSFLALGGKTMLRNSRHALSPVRRLLQSITT